VKREPFLAAALFGQLEKVIKEKVNNVYAQECGLYSDKYMVAGRVDCIAEYDGVLSIIDFKTSRSERNDDWNESYYIQASAYAEMFEERTGTPIEQIVILVVTEDGVVQEFIKNKTDYLPKLINAVDDFTQDWEKENEKLDESPAVTGYPV
jgi:genome maintenance exonuclease 1